MAKKSVHALGDAHIVDTVYDSNTGLTNITNEGFIEHQKRADWQTARRLLFQCFFSRYNVQSTTTT
jgi:hypothetical protein